MSESLEITEFFIGMRKDGRVQWLFPAAHPTEGSARTLCAKKNELDPSYSCEYVVVESKRQIEFEVLE